MEQTGCRNDSIVFHFNLTGKLGGVSDDAAITDDTVVSHMHVLHQQVTVANHRLALGSGSAANGYILADRIVVAYLAGSLFTLELQVLGLGGDGRAWEELVIVTDSCTIMYGDVIEQLVVVANDYVFVDDTERTNHVTVA